jgi:uncharacterized protein
MITRNQAWELLTSRMQNQNLRRHCLSVEAVLRSLAHHFQADADKWGIVGLLHDGDYEIAKDNPSQHTLLMADWLADLGETDAEIISAILSHNFSHTGQHPPFGNLEWSLFCSDELTGLIVATALVQPSRKLADVTVDSVLKKFPQKSFAAGVKREDISRCEEKLGIPLPEFISIALSAMQGIAPEIGL